MPEPAGEILGAVLGIAAVAAVAHAHVEEPVGPEGELAAVVVRVGLGDVEELAGLDGLSAARAVLLHARVALGVGEVDVEEPVRLVVGMERHREQALLAAVGDVPDQVEERLRQHVASLDDADPADLLDDVETAGLAGRARREHRSFESRRRIA